MNHLKKTFGNRHLWLFALILLTVAACKDDDIVETNAVIDAFRAETGIDAIWLSDTTLLNTVESWQGSGDYPGVDDWATATIPAGLDLYGGLPGQSEYYTIDETLMAADTMQVPYWESLQVKAHPDFGYRPDVGVYDLNSTITVAIARTLANPQYGTGGAWQIYVENFDTDLTLLETIPLLIPTNPVIEAFRADTGIDAIWVSDTTLLNTVEGWQGSGDYPGVDDWATATIPAGLDLYGGLPGQSEYYTIDETLMAADTMQVPYWESLQVKAHPDFGYRPDVGVYDLNSTITVAIARTLANPQYGTGGAWQIYVEDYGTDLSLLETIPLQQ